MREREVHPKARRLGATLLLAAAVLLGGCEDKEVRQQLDSQITSLRQEKNELARQLDAKRAEGIELEKKNVELARELRAEILSARAGQENMDDLIRLLTAYVAAYKFQNRQDVIQLRQKVLTFGNQDGAGEPTAPPVVRRLLEEIELLAAKRDALEDKVAALQKKGDSLAALLDQYRQATGQSPATQPDLFDDVGPTTRPEGQ